MNRHDLGHVMLWQNSPGRFLLRQAPHILAMKETLKVPDLQKCRLFITRDATLGTALPGLYQSHLPSKVKLRKVNR